MSVQVPSFTSTTWVDGSAPPINAASKQQDNAVLSALGGKTLAVPATLTTVTLYAAQWSGSPLSQTVAVSGITANSTIIVSPAPLSFSAWANGVVRCTSQGSGSLSFSATYQPADNITVNICVVDSN